MSNDNKLKNRVELERVRHSISHLMSMAIMELYPKTGLGVGPFIENGFYQDYDLPESISNAIFPKLEKRIKQLIKQDIKFKQHAVSFAEALKLYQDDPYKTELIEDLKKAGEKDVSFYKSDWFENLCKGPHVKSTKEINPDAFKLTKIAGSYWKGDEKNKMLTRIYGVAFALKQELDDHLAMLAEAEKRDHRKIGKELDLFIFSDLVGAGLPLYTPRGTIIMHELKNYLMELKGRKGYQQVDIPHLAKNELYKVSGHWEKFKNDIFHVTGMSEEFVLKPMNCPHHIQIYAARPRSYRDLPIRYAEMTKQYRDEQTGELHGLSRVRSITIDDTHIFCRKDQILAEANAAFDIIRDFAKTFGLKQEIGLSIRDLKHKEKYLGSDALWQEAEADLKKVLKTNGHEFKINEGEAAFYGPKIDFLTLDSLGRAWQLSTIQLDFNLPDRFSLEYTNEKGEKEKPVMLHIAVAGSIERFLSVIIEHFAGVLPLWLSPVQVKILSVGSAHEKFCLAMAEKFKTENIRAETDLANETVGNKIRKASAERIPYMLVIGDKEMASASSVEPASASSAEPASASSVEPASASSAEPASDKLAVRVRGQEKLLEKTFAEFAEKLQKLIKERSLEL